jgi:peptide/nickel transport system substrate-binding protein
LPTTPLIRSPFTSPHPIPSSSTSWRSRGAFIPHNPNNINAAEFCDPRIDAQAQQALALEQRDPAVAAGRWAAIDRELVNMAPWVPLYNPRDLNVLSARVGNYQFHPYWNVLIDQLWVR